MNLYLQQVAPPPLTGEYVNNIYMWVLAFAPIIVSILDGIFLSIKYDDNFWLALTHSNFFWYITLVLNNAISWLDSQALKKAGHDPEKFSRLGWLVPVYMYYCAQHLKQKQICLVI